jgi:asparagine synthase (glutamine-hydrolysing)
MCGILGIAGAAPAGALDAVELLRHRGPDGDGRYVGGDVGLAMRRLAIIDPETGDQPVANESGDVVAVVNGELYNYRELRAELVSKGHAFRGEGDVEIVPHLYEEHGEAFVERLRGMFALALWDERPGRLVLARDRFGIKPLYLAEVGGALAFASELRPLLALGASAEEDADALAGYAALGWISGEATGVRGVRRLLPGRVLVRENGAVRERRYWEPARPTEAAPLADTLGDAVRLHLRSDVPLAVLLSGGLDSSLIAALAAGELEEPLRTFSVGFADAEYDERGPARAVAAAIGSRHEELLVETRVADDLPEIAASLEQPLADGAAIPLWYLCRAVAAEVKVALAGDGGDEVFGGYSRYAWDARAARLGSLRRLAGVLGRVPHGSGRKDVVRRAAKLLRHAGRPEAERYAAWFGAERGSEWFERLFADAPRGLTPLGRLQSVDLGAMLADDLMLKADKLSMAHSLELRVPFLDHEVVSAGLFLPDREKVRGVRTKVAIRRLVAERLPAEIARRPKQGFDVPLDRWLRGELRELAGDALVGDGAALALLDRHARREVDAGQELYSALMLALWRSSVAAARAAPLAAARA